MAMGAASDEAFDAFSSSRRTASSALSLAASSAASLSERCAASSAFRASTSACSVAYDLSVRLPFDGFKPALTQ
eukprot:6485370-Prymnesium_polylepis.1